MEPVSQVLLVNQLEQLVTKFDLITHNYPNSELHQCLLENEISLTYAHVLAYIGDHDKTNAVSIANALNITRSGISKITTRLLKKGLIQIQYAENSKKNLSYTLTPEGQKIYLLHAASHTRIHTQVEELIDRYTEEEIACIAKFLNDLTELYNNAISNNSSE